MTRLVTKVGECLIYGLSTDTKPTPANETGFGFFEIDTGRLFLCNGSAWNEVTAYHAWGAITGTLSDQTDLQTALNAKQPLDSDLTTIAGLTPTTDNVIQSVAGAWASRTMAQLKAVLALVIGDVSGLQTALDAKQATLVSGTNIKTINGATVLGSGDLVVSGAADVKQTEVDFGTVPVWEASFLVTDAAVSASSHLIGNVAYVAPTGKDLDEMEMDGLDLKFAPGTGNFTIYARGQDGPVHDKFLLNYLVG